MTLGSFEVVFFTVGFLVPGFVWSAVLSMIVPRRAELPQIRALEYLTLSCINHGIWSWAIYWMFATDWPSEHPFLPGMCFGGIIFLFADCVRTADRIFATERGHGRLLPVTRPADDSFYSTSVGLAFQSAETLLGRRDPQRRIEHLRAVPQSIICIQRCRS